MDHHFLTYGRLSEDFEAYIHAKQKAIKVVRAETKEQVKRLLPDVNAVAGFNFLEGHDIGHIQWIHSFGAGVDSYLQLDGFHHDLVLSRTSGDLSIKMAECCAAYVLQDLRALPSLADQQSNADWNQLPTKNLYDQNILILGTGTIGQGIGKYFQRMCNQVIGLSKNKHKKPGFDDLIDWKDLKKGIAADIVINTLPNTKETVGILDHAFFDRFGDAFFINIGRGETVHEDALFLALQNGQVRKAVLDVFEIEPLPKDSKLWTHPDILISPHQSGITTIEDVIEGFESVLQAIEQEETHPLMVDIKKGY